MCQMYSFLIYVFIAEHQRFEGLYLTSPQEGLEQVTLNVAEDVPGKPTGGSYRDVWNHKDVHIFGGQMPLVLNTHDSVLAVLTQTTAAEWWW